MLECTFTGQPRLAGTVYRPNASKFVKKVSYFRDILIQTAQDMPASLQLYEPIGLSYP